MEIDDVLDEYADQLSTFHYSTKRTREILAEMFDKCNGKVVFSASKQTSEIYFKCSNCGTEYKYIMGKNCPICGKDEC